MSSSKKPEDLRISISGVRGVVGHSFTDKRVSDFTASFASLMKRGKILVAQDTRPTGRRFRSIIIRRLRECGCSVVDIGVSPTPTVLLNVRALRASGAIVVTASHNPAGWNGLKFVGPDGQFLNEPQMKRLIGMRPLSFSQRLERQGPLREDRSAVARHLSEVLRHLDVQKIRSRHFRVAIDPCNGTGAVATSRFLKALGCQVLAINNVPNGHFAHPPEPTREHLGHLSRYVRQTKADIGFAQDPDADRLTVVTEKGEALNGEYTLALAVAHILSKRKTPVVVNLSTSRMIEDIVREKRMKIYYSKIGERHVVEKMQKVKAAIGGEGNGGVIYPTINAARDSFVGIGLILEFLAHSGKSLSRALEAFPRYTMLQQKLTLPKKRVNRLLKALPGRFQRGRMNRLDGVRIDLKEGWIHVRPSNTEPVVRFIAEASSKEIAKRLLSRAV